ncbi:MAG: dTDP-4-dehydrorhamnose reductase [Desulfomonile tiedjei]|nr:dTDP-4-dehydrorhamnose reductase [Desulfomonile tiedjei]
MRGFEEPYLVIGAKGMLGTDLVTHLHREGIGTVSMDVDEVDIGDPDSVKRAFAAAKPGTVINVAALTDVDGCEAVPDQAFRVNATGPKLVATACRDARCSLVHISTDYVFDGLTRTPYREEDPMNPLGVYGRSKTEGEVLVRQILPEDHCIVRTQWLFGLHGKNFVATILNLAEEQGTLRVVDDQHGVPTYTPDLAAALLTLCRAGARGTFHVTNSGITTWYGFALRILERAGLGAVKVDPMTTRELGRPAPRPLYSVLDTTRFVALAGKPLRSWQDALDDYLRVPRPGQD